MTINRQYQPETAALDQLVEMRYRILAGTPDGSPVADAPVVQLGRDHQTDTGTGTAVTI
jgi:hypothetical protein